MQVFSRKRLNNQQIGKSFEDRWCAYVCHLGYWVHFLNPAPNGSQPFDVIAIQCKSNSMPSILAMDCKTLAGRRFPIERAEENQVLSFRALNQFGIDQTWFVVECQPGYVRWIPSRDVEQAIQNGQKSISMEGYELVYFGVE